MLPGATLTLSKVRASGLRSAESLALRVPEMGRLSVDRRLAERLLERSGGGRWGLTADAFAGALERSAGRAFADRQPSARELERFCESLHLADLALATACAEGHEAAWEHFVREHRAVLYRSADALDPAGGARELADSLYADLYGLDDRSGAQRSLFRYYHGRSSLATWLRAVLAQRHVDRFRTERRMEPLAEAHTERAVAPVARGVADADHARLLALITAAVTGAIARLDPRDRLRLALYYAQGLKLAEIGRLMREHEATVSRHLARTRRALRRDIEHELRRTSGLSDAEIAESFRCAMDDAGPMDLGEIFAAAEARKESPR
jgi:RNA polymerase sigma-70 factor, ECF subfamily